MVVDHIRRRHRRRRAHLPALELGAAGSIQDAAQLVLSAGAADRGGARSDRVRARDAVRSGGSRRLRRLPPGGGLSLHRPLARGESARLQPRPRNLGDGERDGKHPQGIVFSHRQDQRDGVLLFVGSGIFSAAFALLGGQELIEKWVLSLDMTPVQFMILAQFIIFILGWPLEWTEIIIIFMPIFLPLLPHFNIDPLFFGLLVALNLQTAFLSPPVAMAAFYLKGVSPPHVTLNAIFAGMMPFMGIQVLAVVILYLVPQIGLWLPSVVYGR